MEDKLRAFVAVRMGAPVEAAIGEFVADLRTPDDGIRWIPAVNLHLTLKFLGGAVPISKIQLLVPALKEIAERTRPFAMEVHRVGGFPNLARANVLWIGLSSDELVRLAKEVEDAAAQCGFDREGRPFKAHLTIAHIKDFRISRRVGPMLKPFIDRRFGIARIDRMTLYRSITSPKGARYDALAEFPFNGRE